MAKPRITIALSHYDRHVPFFDGTVQPEGIDLNVLIVGQSDRPVESVTSARELTKLLVVA